MTDEFPVPSSLNVAAAVVLVLSALVAAVGMFLLPTLTDAGLSFRDAFVAVSALEFVAAVAAGLSAMALYGDPEVSEEVE